jgi:repressor LexA
MNELGDFIKSKRLSMDLSLRDFAKLCDLSHTHIDSIEKGYDFRTGKPVRITNETLTKIAFAIDVEPSLLFDLSIGLVSENTKVPVLGRIIAGIPLEAINDIIDYEEIPKAMARLGEYFGLQVRKQSDIENGDIAVVLINGYDATLKKVTKQENGIMLTAYNPEAYPPKFYTNEEIINLPVEILGKVIELRAKF